MQFSIVVNLRTEQEMTNLPFDEEALVTELGMDYVSIPVTPASFCLADVVRFGKLVNRRCRREPPSEPAPIVMDRDTYEDHRRLSGCDRGCRILIHGDTSDRAGAMWAALLHGWTNTGLDTSIQSGMDAGLQSEEMIEALRSISRALWTRKRGKTDWPYLQRVRTPRSFP